MSKNFVSTNAANYNRVEHKSNSLIKYLTLYIDPDESYIDEEILNTIESVPFNKIQIPLYCNRSITEEGGDSNRFITIGNILGYDINKRRFKVIIHKQYIDVINDKLAECTDGEMYAAVQFKPYKDRLNNITKIHLQIIDYAKVNNEDEDYEVDSKEEAE